MTSSVGAMQSKFGNDARVLIDTTTFVPHTQGQLALFVASVVVVIAVIFALRNICTRYRRRQLARELPRGNNDEKTMDLELTIFDGRGSSEGGKTDDVNKLTPTRNLRSQTQSEYEISPLGLTRQSTV